MRGKYEAGRTISDIMRGLWALRVSMRVWGLWRILLGVGEIGTSGEEWWIRSGVSTGLNITTDERSLLISFFLSHGEEFFFRALWFCKFIYPWPPFRFFDTSGACTRQNRRPLKL